MEGPLLEKVKVVFREDGSIPYSIYMRKMKPDLMSLNDIKNYYQHLNSGSQLPENYGPNLKAHKACCLYFLSKEDEKYIEEFTSTLMGSINKKNDPVDNSNMFLIYNIIYFFNEYFDKIGTDGTKYFRQYLDRFSNLGKNFENFLLFSFNKGILSYRGKDYSAAHEFFKSILILFCQKGEKIRLNNYLIVVRDKAADFIKILLEHLDKENIKKIQMEALNSYCDETHYCIPILQELLKDIKKKKNPNSKENVELLLGVASRIGYIGYLLNEPKLIEESINEMKKAIASTDEWIKSITEEKDKDFKKNKDIEKNKDTEKDKDNEKDKDTEKEEINPENWHKLSINYAYKFVLSILNLASGTKNSELRKIGQDFRNNFLPSLTKDSSNGTLKCYVISKKNKNDFILNLSVLEDEDNELVAYITKETINSVISDIKKGKVIESSRLLTFIFSVNNAICYLSESVVLEKDEGKKIEYENTIIEYAETLLDYMSKQNKSNVILNKDVIHGVVIDIYGSLIQRVLAKNDFNTMTKYNDIFQQICETFNITENSPSYGLVYKVKGDCEYFNKNTDAAEDFYKKAIHAGYDKPIIYLNLGLIQFMNIKKTKPGSEKSEKEQIEANIADSIASLKRYVELVRAINLNEFPNDSRSRKEIIQKNYSMAKKLLKHLSNPENLKELDKE